jgi:ribosomal protein S27AE
VRIRAIIKGMSINGILLVLLDDKGQELKRLCPHCGAKKVISEFGLRSMTARPSCAPVVRLQPWCTPCRSDERRAVR